MTGNSPGVRAFGAVLGVLLFAACYRNADNTVGATDQQEWYVSGFWDLRTDFLPNQNPSGTWSFGWPVSGTFMAFPAFEMPVPGYDTLGVWSQTVGDPDGPIVVKNFSDSPVDVGILTYAPRMVILHPSPTEPAVVRWTSPVNGVVLIEGFATTVQQGCGDGTSLTVRSGTTVLATYTLPASAASGATLDLDINVVRDDTIDFEIGPRAYYNCDSTSLDISITALSN